MSWVGQIALNAYLVIILGTVALLFLTILLAASDFPSPTNDGSAPKALPGRKATGTRLP